MRYKISCVRLPDKFLFVGVMVCNALRLPLTRELSAKLTEGEKMLRF